MFVSGPRAFVRDPSRNYRPAGGPAAFAPNLIFFIPPPLAGSPRRRLLRTDRREFLDGTFARTSPTPGATCPVNFVLGDRTVWE